MPPNSNATVVPLPSPAQAQARVLESCETPLQREMAELLLRELEDHGPRSPRSRLKLIETIGRAVALVRSAPGGSRQPG